MIKLQLTLMLGQDVLADKHSSSCEIDEYNS